MTGRPQDAGGRPGEALAQLHQRLRERRPGEALALLARLDAATRRDPRVQACEAYAAALGGRIGQARGAAQAALLADGLDALSLDLAGNALTLCHDAAGAYDAFARAARLAPHDIELLVNLAAAARFLGREAEAEQALDEVLARAPTTWRAWRNRSELRPQTPADNHVEAIERLLREARPPWQGEVQLLFALGKEYEDLEQHEQAFDAFARAAALRRGRMRYDVQADVETLAQITEAFDAAYCAGARARRGTPGPVFILGLPRTGSTLLERLLARSADVQPLGELQQFAAVLVEAARGSAAPASGKAGLIEASARIAPEPVGRAYLDAVRPLRDASPAFIDKLPLNYLYAGAIARALPDAAVIHVRRKAADVCWAMFKTLFDEAYPFSYDLAELGRYHNAYRRLLAHWREGLGPRLVEIAYEDLVADPELRTAEVLAAAGLKAQAGEGGGAAPVMTASASQVRRPVHQRSVDNAARHAHRLQPLFEVLEQPDEAA
ncbi:MAG: sulfotransferase [Caulobacteraceae bacterium]|nr:sulfotransferase [Caulobacteraceae bacterium]